MHTVREWMTTPAIVAPETTTLPAARAMLKEHGVRRLPVVTTQGELVGIITEGDINRVSDTPSKDVREYDLIYRIRDLPIREIMTREVHTVSPDTPLADVAHLLMTHRFGGVPVIENGQVVGVITEIDLFRLIANNRI